MCNTNVYCIHPSPSEYLFSYQSSWKKEILTKETLKDCKIRKSSKRKIKK